MMLRSFGVDPKAIAESVKGFQELLMAIAASLRRIEETQKAHTGELAQLQAELSVIIAQFERSEIITEVFNAGRTN